MVVLCRTTFWCYFLLVKFGVFLFVRRSCGSYGRLKTPGWVLRYGVITVRHKALSLFLGLLATVKAIPFGIFWTFRNLKLFEIVQRIAVKSVYFVDRNGSCYFFFFVVLLFEHV